MERRLAAILAADMVGYSRLIEADEAEAQVIAGGPPGRDCSGEHKIIARPLPPTLWIVWIERRRFEFEGLR